MRKVFGFSFDQEPEESAGKLLFVMEKTKNLISLHNPDGYMLYSCGDEYYAEMEHALSWRDERKEVHALDVLKVTHSLCVRESVKVECGNNNDLRSPSPN